ncbi:putative serine/threonine-protein kinase PBL25 [Heracleum sosnowskyi]|uniref:Serine/threonine-protein kinase PBL25 n=1 Tax=Heracleum sosnowskyi TaxID=360622 RepID=A0AAD8JED2_9APIA|nr:putative serine/threonine-protein kinase PBL25 [Heracleum sosnowskyi]
MAGFEPISTLASPGDSVIVVIDANRNKVMVDALAWAIRNIVQPKDTVVVLGLLSEVWKKNACIPLFSGTLERFFYVTMSYLVPSLDDDELAGVRLEFSGQGELSPKEFEEELERKREEYQSALQPFYRQCKKNGVKLEAKLAVGYDPKTITVEKAQKFNPRWIILDSHLKRDKVYIYGHVACNVAVMKEKGVATLMPSRGLAGERLSIDKKDTDAENEPDIEQDECNDLAQDSMWVLPTLTAPQSPCWYPLSWRSGFPKVFSLHELEVMTNGFSKENVMVADEDKIVYDGICQETPVIVKKFSADDDQALSLLKILSRVRHRNIFNLVGYCCTHDVLALLFDYPCSGALKLYLQSDESAKNLSWKARWCIALDIGAAIRYLHEECIDGPIVDVFLDSWSVVICHGSSSLLNIHHKAKWLKHDSSCDDLSQEKCQGIETEKRLLADVSAYGMLLIELITGKSEQPSKEWGEGYPSLVHWALPLLENGLVSEVLDPRLVRSTDSAKVDNMVRAALLCLNKDSGNRSMISEALAVLRGEEFAVSIKA